MRFGNFIAVMRTICAFANELEDKNYDELRNEKEREINFGVW